MQTILLLAIAATLPGAEHYLAAREAEAAVRYGDALSAYEACIDLNGPLAPYSRIRAAHCRSQGGDPEGAIAQYETVLAEEPDGPWLNMARVYLAALYVREEDRARATPLYSAFLSAKPTLWWTSRYSWRAAENLLENPATASQGYAHFRNVAETVLYRGPRLQASIRLAESEWIEDRLAAARGMVLSDSAKKANPLLREIAASLAGTDEIKTAFLDEITLGGDAKNEPTAGLLTAHEQWAALEVIWLAHAVHRELLAQRPTQAEAACVLLEKRYPDDLLAGEARWRMARYFERNDEFPEAIAHYRRLADKHRRHRRADDALIAAGRLLESQGEDEEALKAYQRLRKRHADSRHFGGACYQSGRIHEQMGKKKAALRSFMQAIGQGVGKYYAHRAYQRIHEFPGASEKTAAPIRSQGLQVCVTPFPLPEDAAISAASELRADPRFTRLFFFGRHGFEEGEWEALGLAPALREDPPQAAAMYRLMAEAGLACTAGQIASAHEWGIRKGRPTTARNQLSYPLAYWEHVRAIGAETGIDPYLILAVARQESTFRPTLASSAGAQGIMQVMPATAKWMAQVEPRISKSDAQHLNAPIPGLRLGAYYLMRMLDSFDGNIALALAAYNAGPGNARRWKKAFGDEDPDRFIESITFPETRGYVKAVLGNYAAYYSLYPPLKRDASTE